MLEHHVTTFPSQFTNVANTYTHTHLIAIIILHNDLRLNINGGAHNIEGIDSNLINPLFIGINIFLSHV